jgi:hypothetical protein
MAREVLGKISIQELEMKIGQLKYISVLPGPSLVEELIQEILHGVSTQIN